MSPEPAGVAEGSGGPQDREARQCGGGRWIVDGNNVMGSRPDGWWRNRRAAAERLTSQVVALRKGPDLEVVLVFDGSGPDATGQPGTEVVYSGRGSADDAIVALVQAAPDRPTIVFTSDAGLRRRVVAAGGEVSGARSFLRMLEGQNH